MANVSRPDQDEKEQLGPDGNPVDASGQAAAAPAASQQRFPDISRLLNANAGRGKGVAQTGINAADALGNQAQSALNAANGQYQNQVAAGTPAGYTAATGPAAGTGGGLGAGSQGRAQATTTQNVAPNLQAAQTAATAAYTGPTALGNSTADLTGAQAALTKAGDAYGALGQGSPSRQSGGAGFLNNTLAQQQAGGDLKAASQRFQGLRNQFNQTVGDTSASDAAKANAAGSRTAAQGDINANAADVAAVNQHNTDLSNSVPLNSNNGPDYDASGNRIYYNNGKQVTQTQAEMALQNLQDWKDATAAGNKLPFQDWLQANGRK